MIFKALLVAFVPILVSCNQTSGVHQGPLMETSFEDMQSRIDAPAGATVHLSCPVRRLGRGFVIWYKGPGSSNILSIGHSVWVSDGRISVSSHESTDTASPITTHNLTITDVTTADSGSYYCRVRAGRHIDLTSPSIELQVVGGSTEPTPSVTVTGTNFVDLGSPLSLTCQTSPGFDSPLSWFKDGNRIVATENSGISISQTDSTSNMGPTSTLLIRHAQMSNTGHYVCAATLRGVRHLAQATVHVLNTARENLRNGRLQGS